MLHGLLQHLGPQEEDSSGITIFKCMVKQEIEERWELNDLDVSSCLVLSAVLDPCFKPLKFLSEEKLEAVKIELRELKAFLLYLLIMMLRASTREEV